MSNNYRKLLPYEHQLVHSLGITKEQYLDFVLQQQEYIDAKQGTVYDIRNDFGLVALILTVVGTLAQIAAALLMPKPNLPSAAGQRQQTRDDIFAPRFGFNSVQNLAQYGDPVHLVYTNTDANPNGGIRVATSLLWSSVKSFGSSQYVQLLLLLGAGSIGAIDYNRTAFGQTPLRDLIAQNYWLYFRPGSTGAIRGDDLKFGGNGELDPAANGVGGSNLYRVAPAAPDASGDGFSHALSPAISNRFGCYSLIPLNVSIIIRNEAGREESAPNRIEASSLGGWGAAAPNATLGFIGVGEILTVTLASTVSQEDTSIKEEAADQRRALSSAFDNAGIFKLGSAIFSVLSANRGSTDEGDMVVTLRCIEAGLAPSIRYNANTAAVSAQDLATEDPVYEELKARVESLLNEDRRPSVKTAKDLLKVGNIFTFDPPPEPPLSPKEQRAQALSSRGIRRLR